tara:strand:- start:945 stop:1139 length:195 start_codon:yes stop_codon:yes gene_type:complete
LKEEGEKNAPKKKHKKRGEKIKDKEKIVQQIVVDTGYLVLLYILLYSYYRLFIYNDCSRTKIRR